MSDKETPKNTPGENLPSSEEQSASIPINVPGRPANSTVGSFGSMGSNNNLGFGFGQSLSNSPQRKDQNNPGAMGTTSFSNNTTFGFNTSKKDDTPSFNFASNTIDTVSETSKIENNQSSIFKNTNQLISGFGEFPKSGFTAQKTSNSQFGQPKGSESATTKGTKLSMGNQNATNTSGISNVFSSLKSQPTQTNDTFGGNLNNQNNSTINVANKESSSSSFGPGNNLKTTNNQTSSPFGANGFSFSQAMKNLKNESGPSSSGGVNPIPNSNEDISKQATSTSTFNSRPQNPLFGSTSTFENKVDATNQTTPHLPTNSENSTITTNAGSIPITSSVGFSGFSSGFGNKQTAPVFGNSNSNNPLTSNLPVGSLNADGSSPGTNLDPTTAPSTASFSFGASTNKPFGDQTTSASGTLFNNQPTATPKINEFGNDVFSKSEASNIFGSQTTEVTRSSLAQNQSVNRSSSPATSTGLFGNQTTTPSAGTLFGAQANNSAFGSTNFGGQGSKLAATPSNLFGAQTNSAAPSTNLFGSQTNNAAPAPTGLFGGKPNSAVSASANLFGGQTSNSSSAPTSLFGGQTTNATPAPTNLFGAQNNSAVPASNSSFGAQDTTTVPASTNPTVAPVSNSLFGSQTNSAALASTSLFGGQKDSPMTASSNLFGVQNAVTSSVSTNQTIAPASNSLFGNQANNVAPTSTNLFGTQTNNAAPASTNLFGGQTSSATSASSSLFGAQATTVASSSNSLFGSQPSISQAPKVTPAPLFGNQSTSTPVTTSQANVNGNVTFGANSTSTLVPAITSSTGTASNLFGGQQATTDASSLLTTTSKKAETVTETYNLDPSMTLGDFFKDLMDQFNAMKYVFNEKSEKMFNIDKRIHINGGKIKRIYKTLSDLEEHQKTLIGYLDYLDCEQDKIETTLRAYENDISNIPKSTQVNNMNGDKYQKVEREELYLMLDDLCKYVTEITDELSKLDLATKELISKFLISIDPSLKEYVQEFSNESRLTRNVLHELKKSTYSNGSSNNS